MTRFVLVAEDGSEREVRGVGSETVGFLCVETAEAFAHFFLRAGFATSVRATWCTNTEQEYCREWVRHPVTGQPVGLEATLARLLPA